MHGRSSPHVSPLATALAAVMLCATATAAAAASPASARGASPEEVSTPAVVGAPVGAPGLVDVVVRLVPGVDPDVVAATLPRPGADRAGTPATRRVYRSAFPGFSGRVDAAGLASLRADPRVAAVEPDHVISLSDTQSPVVWGLDRTDQRARPLTGSFTFRSTGTGAAVYVPDTGINATHAEFGGRVRSGFDAIGDGRGTDDCEGHGTHVAATAAGATFGIAKTATPVAVRVLGCDGTGTLSGVLAGLDWIMADHATGAPAVVNLSLGGPSSAILDQAVQALHDDGISVVAAAGNENADACGTSPARVPAAVTVAATDATDTRPTFSNRGPCVDVFAPGVAIRSASAADDVGSVVLSGTSMAAPHAAGVLAVMRAAEPGLGADAASARLLRSATPGAVRSRGAGSPDRLLSQSSAPPTAECPAGDDRTTTGRRPRPAVVVARRDLSPVRYDLLAVGSSAAATAITVDGLAASTRVVSAWENRAGCSGVDASRSAWAVTPSGRVFGEAAPLGPPAGHHGDASSLSLNRPVVGMSPTASGLGYWLVASDGGIFSYGDARFHGSTGAIRLNQPIVGMATTPSGRGYWLVASDGGIFTFGDAVFRGSTGALRLTRPITGMTATPTGRGYWLVASDGGVFTFGDATFHGSTGGRTLTAPIVGLLPRPGGYVLVGADGALYPFGS